MWHVMKVDLDDPRFRGVTVREVVKKVVWARNCQLTISGYSPIEIATGRRPPDLFDLETASPCKRPLLRQVGGAVGGRASGRASVSSSG